MDINHFVESGFVPHLGWLDDETYSKVLDNIVVTCADVIVLNTKGKILLGKRTYYPAKGWWIAGGRMTTGESFEKAAARNMKRELGLTISPERFAYLGTYSFVWAMRRQPPAENGSHTVSITMTLLINEKEAAAIKPNEEYEELKWWDPELVAEDSQFFPPIRQYAGDIIRRGAT